MKNVKYVSKSAVGILTVCVMIIGRASTAFGWGNEGHEIVAGIADIRLRSQEARKQIEEILEGQALSDVATWADTVKKRQPPKPGDAPHANGHDDGDTVAFIQQLHSISDPVTHKKKGGSGSWHFVNLPLGAKGYNDPPMPSPLVGTPEENDIVMKLKDCINVLRSNAPIHGAFGKKNALRMLVHLAGDIHQPLHVGCGYFDPKAINANTFFISTVPEIIAQHLERHSDIGGNILFFPLQSDDEELHAFWDEVLVEDAIGAAADAHRFISASNPVERQRRFVELLATEPTPAAWNSGDGIDTWPVQWANDSLTLARTAYQGITVSDTKEHHDFVTPFSSHSSGFLVTLPDGYESNMTPLAEAQLSKGGFRLARLLDAIWPSLH